MPKMKKTTKTIDFFGTKNYHNTVKIVKSDIKANLLKSRDAKPKGLRSSESLYFAPDIFSRVRGSDDYDSRLPHFCHRRKLWY